MVISPIKNLPIKKRFAIVGNGMAVVPETPADAVEMVKMMKLKRKNLML